MIGNHALVQLEDGEHIVLEIRRHLFVFYARIAFIVVLFFIPLFFAPLLISTASAAGAPGGIMFTFYFFVWLLALWVIFFMHWTDYYLDVWIVTNRRVIDVEQKGVFHFEVSTFRLEQIQDVTIEVKGVLATFLKFGTIHIHTAGESPDFVIRDAANPIDVKEALIRTHGTAMERLTNVR